MSAALRTYAPNLTYLFAAAMLLALLAWAMVPRAAFATAPSVAGQELAAVSFALDENAEAAVSEDAGEGMLAGRDFGLTSFTRYNKGTNRAVDGAYYGYRWPMPSADSLAVIPTEAGLLIYIPAHAAESCGADIADQAFAQSLVQLLATLDAAKSAGGQVFSDSCPATAYLTSAETVDWNGYTYRFGVEIEQGHFYATSTLVGSEDGSGGGLYMLSGELVPASEMNIVEAPSGFAWLARFLSTLDWSPLWVSLRTTVVATIIIFVIGLLAAWGTIKTSERIKGVLDTVFTIPMVLPPTVCGFLLLLFFGKSTAVGRWLIGHGIDIVFTWPAAVIACVVVGFPLMYRTARGAFENLEPTMLDAARTLGWSEPRIFRTLMMPLAWPSIAAGTVLAFARAMGEFGATLFFAGNFAGITQTMPLAIYFDWMGGKSETAIFWVIVVILFSFLVILFINIYSAHVQKYRSTGGRRSRGGQSVESADTGVAEFAIDDDAARRLGFAHSDRMPGNTRSEGER